MAGLGSLSGLFLAGGAGQDPPLIEGDHAGSDALSATRLRHVRRQAREGRNSESPATRDFYEGSQDRVLANDALGATVFDDTNQTHGLTVAVDFYAVTRYDDTSSVRLVEHPAFDGVCQRLLGTGAGDFLQQWDSFVRRS